MATELAGYIERAIEGFDRDPPDSDFQRGYLECLKVLRRELCSDPVTTFVSRQKWEF